MNVPDGIIELTVVSVVGFVFKVVFGLIGKNEKKSEEEDKRLEEEIKDLRRETRDLSERHRLNENDLFRLSAKTREDVAYEKGKSESRRELEDWIRSNKKS